MSRELAAYRKLDLTKRGISVPALELHYSDWEEGLVFGPLVRNPTTYREDHVVRSYGFILKRLQPETPRQP